MPRQKAKTGEARAYQFKEGWVVAGTSASALMDMVDALHNKVEEKEDAVICPKCGHKGELELYLSSCYRDEKCSNCGEIIYCEIFVI